MPFVGTVRAQALLKRELMPEKVGDLCCLAYIPMVQKFLANTSWSTIHRIRKDVRDGTWNKVFLLSRAETIPEHLQSEVDTAVDLAWEVFFGLYGLKYEMEKRMTNGGVIDKWD